MKCSFERSSPASSKFHHVVIRELLVLRDNLPQVFLFFTTLRA